LKLLLLSFDVRWLRGEKNIVTHAVFENAYCIHRTNS